MPVLFSFTFLGLLFLFSRIAFHLLDLFYIFDVFQIEYVWWARCLDVRSQILNIEVLVVVLIDPVLLERGTPPDELLPPRTLLTAHGSRSSSAPPPDVAREPPLGIYDLLARNPGAPLDAETMEFLDSIRRRRRNALRRTAEDTAEAILASEAQPSTTTTSFTTSNHGLPVDHQPATDNPPTTTTTYQAVDRASLALDETEDEWEDEGGRYGRPDYSSR